MSFSQHLKNVLTLNKFFSTKLTKKRNYASNHLASNLESLFPNIPLIPLHYQIHPLIFRKIYIYTEKKTLEPVGLNRRDEM